MSFGVAYVGLEVVQIVFTSYNYELAENLADKPVKKRNVKMKSNPNAKRTGQEALLRYRGSWLAAADDSSSQNVEHTFAGAHERK